MKPGRDSGLAAGGLRIFAVITAACARRERSLYLAPGRHQRNLAICAAPCSVRYATPARRGEARLLLAMQTTGAGTAPASMRRVWTGRFHGGKNGAVVVVTCRAPGHHECFRIRHAGTLDAAETERRSRGRPEASAAGEALSASRSYPSTKELYETSSQSAVADGCRNTTRALGRRRRRSTKTCAGPV